MKHRQAKPEYLHQPSICCLWLVFSSVETPCLNVQFIVDKTRGPNDRSTLYTLTSSSYLLPLSPRKGRTVDLKTLTLIEEPASTTVSAAGNGNAEPNADELDNAEEEFEKLLKESESVGRVE